MLKFARSQVARAPELDELPGAGELASLCQQAALVARACELIGVSGASSSSIPPQELLDEDSLPYIWDR